MKGERGGEEKEIQCCFFEIGSLLTTLVTAVESLFLVLDVSLVLAPVPFVVPDNLVVLVVSPSATSAHITKSTNKATTNVKCILQKYQSTPFQFFSFRSKANSSLSLSLYEKTKFQCLYISKTSQNLIFWPLLSC